MSLVSINDVLKITTKVEKIHPYKVVGDRDSYSPYNEGWSDCVSLIEHYLEQIPSAEPERKKGKWQRRKGDDCWECSECHAVLENDDLGMHNFYFCYHCGANMMNKSGYMDIEEVHYE